MVTSNDTQQEHPPVGRKKNKDKKIMTGIYHRPTEIEACGGIEAYKRIIYDAIEQTIRLNKQGNHG